MNKHHYVAIMAGGIGSRFWPMSRTAYPKQFLDILGNGETLLQQTFKRLEKICLKENIYVVTSSIYKQLVFSQLPDLIQENVLFEPVRRNTAPCIAFASYKIHKRDPKAIVIVAPSDHLIKKEAVFIKSILSCFKKAEKENCLITLGIKPTRPDTGYGYIQFVKSDQVEVDKRIKKVKTFTEKPDHDMANFFVKSGDFLWNSGMFIWSARAITLAYRRHLRDIYDVFEEATLLQSH